MLNHFDRKANPSRIHITFPMVDIGHYTAAWPFITEVTFENVHHVQIFSFVIQVCLGVYLIISPLRLIENTGWTAILATPKITVTGMR